MNPARPLPEASPSRRPRTAGWLLAAATLAATAGAHAATVWNETGNGDLSGDRLNPTSLSLGVGSNDLFASTQSGDREYFTFSIPSGQTLSSVYLRSYTGGDDRSFFGIQQGTTMTVDPNAPNASNLLGYTHFGRQPATPAVVGTDFLPLVGTGPGSQGFTPPLPANNYTVWVQQLGITPTTYQIDFVVSAVPEPVSTTLCAGALLGTAVALRQRRRRTPVASPR